MLFKGKPFKFQRPFGSYVMENVLFKISFPAEFHAQTAVEVRDAAAPAGASDRIDEIERIVIRDAGAGDPHHRQDRARSPIPPTATTASSTWSPCR